MRIGLVSDTHGLVRPELVAWLDGVDLVLHAGDIGKPAVLDALAAIAPVRAVRGNVDRGAWAEALPTHLDLDLGGLRVRLVHDVADAGELDHIDLVVHGHSHKPRCEAVGAVTFVNPGSIGPRRFSLPIAMALLTVEGRTWRLETRELGRS